MATATRARTSREALERHQRAACLLAAAEIYLEDNCLLEAPLRREDVKERLLGHRGAVSGNQSRACASRPADLERDASVLLRHSSSMPGGILGAHGISSRAASMIERYARMLDDHRAFIGRHGFNPPELAEWRFSSS